MSDVFGGSPPAYVPLVMGIGVNSGRIQQLQAGTVLDPSACGFAASISSAYTIYVSASGSDITGNGTSGSPWASIAKAMSYLKDKWISNGVTVTILLGDGTFAQSSEILVTHPCAAQIFIAGTNTYTRSMTSIQSSSGGAGAWDVILNLTSVANIAVNDYVCVTSVSGGTYPRRLVGCHKVTSVDSGNNRITVRCLSKSFTTMASGAVASTITVLKTILSCTGCNCIRVASVTFGGISKVAIVGNGTAGTCGIRVEAGTMACTAPVGISNFAEGFSCLSGMLYAISSVSSGSTSYGYHSNLGGAIVATYGVASGNAIGFVAEQGSTLAADQGQSVGNTSHGFQAIATSFMVCGSAWSTGNGGAGFYAAGHSQVNAAGSNASYCGADGFAADYASVADFSSTNSSYNPTGMSAHTLAMINATSTTIQHNTTGVYADQMAMLNASTSTIDNTNTTISSPAFNTQGNTFAYIVKS